MGGGGGGHLTMNRGLRVSKYKVLWVRRVKLINFVS